jgi:RNA polymerase sigma factor (sigma-70 family)
MPDSKRSEKGMAANEELAVKARKGDIEARNELILRNKPFIWRMAKKIYTQRPDMDVEDLVHEGIFGLVRAIDGYDPSCGAAFLTYAAYWIRVKMLRALSRENNTVSLQEPIAFNDEGDCKTLEDIIADEHNYFQPVENRIDGCKLWERIKAVLSETQYKIMVYFCFGYEIRQIARKLGISEETARKEKANAEKILRSYKVRGLFEVFLDELLDEEVPILRAWDPGKPVGTGSKLASPVESVVIQRERAIDKIAGK